MTRTGHIIRELEYQIDLESQEGAYELQSSISKLQGSQINNVLNRILDKFDSKNAIYQFDHIDLDLGSISKSNYENELVYRIEEELTKYLSYTIQENGKLRSGSNVILKNRRLEELEHFLKKGFFKWNAPYNLSPSALFETIVQTDPLELAALLKHLGKEDAVRKRMLYQFNDKILEAIVVFVAPKDSNYIIALKENVIEQQEKETLVKTGKNHFKTAIWEIVLAYLFSEKGYHDKKNFLNFLIKNVAQKYNITYKELLTTISKTVNKNTVYATEFKNILVELTTKEIVQEANEEEKKGLIKEDVAVHLEQLTHYVNHGTVSSSLLFVSKKAFNNYLLKMLKTRDARVLFYIDQWLRIHSKKQRIVAIASKEVLQEILKVSTITALKVSAFFIESILSASTVSRTSKAIVSALKEHKTDLIFKLAFSSFVLEKKLIHKLLQETWKLSDASQDDFAQFLLKTKQGLSRNHRKIVDQFLMSFKQQLEDLTLRTISTELQKYTVFNNISSWESWLESRLPSWTQKTQLSREAIFVYLITDLERQDVSVSLINFIKKSKERTAIFLKSEHKQTLEIALLVEEKEEARSIREEVVPYILKNGKLPWWLKTQYSWDTFNSDFTNSWKSDRSKKDLLAIIVKNTKRISYSRILDDHNLKLVWKAVDTSTAKEYSMLLYEVYQFVKESLRATGSISSGHYNYFKEEAFRNLITATGETKSTSIFQFLRDWMTTSKLLESPSLCEGYIRILEKHMPKIGLQMEFEVWLSKVSNENVTFYTKNDAARPLEEFLLPFKKLQNSGTSIRHQIQHLIKEYPAKFNALLQQSAFRKVLLEELHANDVKKLIELRINTQQQAFYKQAQQHLKRFQSFSTEQEYTKICKTLNALLVLRLSANDIQTWSLKDWSTFVFHTINNSIGERKNKDIIFSIQEQLGLEENANTKGDQKRIIQWQKLASENFDTTQIQRVKPISEILSITTEGFLKNATIQEMEAHIVAKVSSSQQLYYEQAKNYILSYGDYISIKDKNALEKCFAQLVISKTQRDDVSAWDLKKWSQLAYYSIQQVIGQKKNNEILLRIKKTATVAYQSIQEQLPKHTGLASNNLEYENTKEIMDTIGVPTKSNAKGSRGAVIKELKTIVLQKITTSQQGFYDQTMRFIGAYATYLSVREYTELNEFLLKFISLKLETNSLRLWKMEDWLAAVYYFSNQVLGSEKNQKTLLRFRESATKSNQTAYTVSFDFFDRLQALSEKRPKQVRKENFKKMDEDERPYKKLGEEIAHEFIDPIFIQNAGLIIIAPYLGMLFQKCGLIENSIFINEKSKHKAVQLLRYAVAGDVPLEEQELIIQKVLCGLEISTPIEVTEEITALEKEIVEGLLNAVIQHWTVLGGTSIDGLRTSFLQRKGKLEEEESQFFLQIEHKSFDMLLDQIPWNITKVNLSWMYKTLKVEWRT